MKQLIQDKKTGEVVLADVPSPAVNDHCVLVQNTVSLLVPNAKKSGASLSLTGSSAGTVKAIGKGVSRIQVGDRVACLLGKEGVHAELVQARETDVLIIPEGISYQEASFLYPTLFCLAAVDSVDIQLGQVVLVVGLGLMGQFLSQILQASGCRVIACDPLKERCEQLVHSDVSTLLIDKNFVDHLTDKIGPDQIDVVFVSPGMDKYQRYLEKIPSFSDLVYLGPFMNIKLFSGVSFHAVDLDHVFQGHFKASIRKRLKLLFHLIEHHRIDLSSLVSHRFSLQESEKGVKLVLGHSRENSLGVLLTYPQGDFSREQRLVLDQGQRDTESRISLNVGLIHMAESSDFCIFNRLSNHQHVNYRTVTANTGIHALELGKLYHFSFCTTDMKEILLDREIHCVIILNQNHDALDLCKEALLSHKDVFVESLTVPDKNILNILIKTYQEAKTIRGKRPQLMLGHSRRYLAICKRMKEFLLEKQAPLAVHIRAVCSIKLDMNSNEPYTELLLEYLHWVDLLQFWIGSDPILLSALTMSEPAYGVSIQLKFRDGSLANLHLIASPDQSEATQRIEILSGHHYAVIDDFFLLEAYRGNKKIFHMRDKPDLAPLRQLEYFLRNQSFDKNIEPTFGDIMMNQLSGLALSESLETGHLIEIKP